MILIDLQKAIDNINHDFLLKKMFYLGFSNLSKNWFESYLSNRSFRLNIQNKYLVLLKYILSTARIYLRTFIISDMCERYESGCRL